MPRMELPHAVINLQQNEVGERAGQGVRADGTKKKSTSDHGMKLE